MTTSVLLAIACAISLGLWLVRRPVDAPPTLQQELLVLVLMCRDGRVSAAEEAGGPLPRRCAHMRFGPSPYALKLDEDPAWRAACNEVAALCGEEPPYLKPDAQGIDYTDIKTLCQDSGPTMSAFLAMNAHARQLLESVEEAPPR